MLRRIHVPSVRVGKITLDAAQARHARDVLRLETGEIVEVFDDAGVVSRGELVAVTPREVVVQVDSVTPSELASDTFRWTIAAAVPKGERADWMIEKLSELGTAEFIPLAAARSVVLPEGKNKRDRWIRIATESAKQSRRAGVMKIAELTSIKDVLKMLTDSNDAAGWCFSTATDALPVSDAATNLPASIRSLVAFIGPEGGWTDGELAELAGAKIIPVRLTQTVLRIETAAVAAAAVIGSILPRRA